MTQSEKLSTVLICTFSCLHLSKFFASCNCDTGDTGFTVHSPSITVLRGTNFSACIPVDALLVLEIKHGTPTPAINFHLKTVTAVAVDQPTFADLVKFKPKTTAVSPDEFESGINVEVYRFLRDALNFTENAFKSRGQMISDNEGFLVNKGIAEALNTDRADIAISLFEMLPYRMAGPYGVRFLHAVYQPSKAIAVFTQPPRNSMRNIYGLPFQTSVWRSLAALYLFLLICMSLFLANTLKISRHSVNKSTLEYLTEIFLQAQHWIICVATRQSFSSDASTPIYLKLVIFTCFMSSVTLHSAYSSALTSILAVDYEPISSFFQLTQRRYILYFDKYVPSIESVLKTIYQKDIYIREMGNVTSKILKNAIPEILDSKSALLTSIDRYYPFFKDKYHDSYLCSKLSVVPLIAREIPSANFVKQGSQLRDAFNTKLLLMRQSGLIGRVYSEYNLKRSLTCFKSNDFPSLDVNDTMFPFCILLITAVLSLLILPCEIITNARLPVLILAKQ